MTRKAGWGFSSIVGQAPIHPVAFLIGKAAIVPPFVFLTAWAVQVQLAPPLPAAARFAGAALAAAGTMLMTLSIQHLGASTRVGLPRESTELKTHGLYRYSRNPIYLGLFATGIGSCFLVPHWFNLLSTTVMIVLHHRIVLGEERFLEGRFGQAWLDYTKRVRRYL